MAAETAAIQDQHRKPFRRGINRRRQTRRAGANDGGVVDEIGIDRLEHADAARQIGLAGIAQDLPARTQHDGQMFGLDGEALQQGLGAAVIVGIQGAMGMAVAAQEILQPQHVGGAQGADQDGTRLTPIAKARRGAGSNARISRSPNSASCTSTSRSRRAGMTMASTSPIAFGIHQRPGRSDSCASSPRKWPGPCWTIAAPLDHSAPPWRFPNRPRLFESAPDRGRFRPSS